MSVTRLPGVMVRVCLAMLLSMATPALAYAAPTFIQSANALVDSGTSATATFAAAQSAGDLVVVMVAWGAGPAPSVTDSSGNAYTLAVSTALSPGADSQAIYYASNIAAASAGSNAVTVSFSGAATYVDERIAEYSGVATSGALDGASGATGTASTANSGSVNTTATNDLLIAGTSELTHFTATSPGFTVRIDNSWADIYEDEVTSSAGSYSATATQETQTGNEWWIIQLAAFKGATGGGGGGGGSGGPSTPANVTATTVSPTEINLTWTASTDSAGVTGYLIERCTGANCTSFTQIGTSATTSFTDSTVTSGNDYSYEIVAIDSTGASSADSAPTNAESQVIYTYSYDSSGRVSQVTGTDGSTRTFSYDGHGNVLTVTKAP